LEEIRVSLDQCWDLLRQRRALRDAGKDPEGAQARSSGSSSATGSSRLPRLLTYNHMVVGRSTDGAVDELFHALADATRRDIVRRCLTDAPSVSRLAEAYPMSFAAVQKHVAVLERAGLVSKERRGREQLVRSDLASVERARRALDQLESEWRERVDRMSGLLAEATEPDMQTTTRGRKR
jgi:DNA-binding transcriptional ArsR family regulator